MSDAMRKIYDWVLGLRLSGPEAEGLRKFFVVINDNILGCVSPERLWTADVLATSVIRGAVHGPLSGPYPMPVDGRDVRLATRQDFREFRVLEDQYDNSPHFEAPREVSA